MDDKTHANDLVNIDNLEVEALSDEDLNSVAGGAEATSTGQTCSCNCCTCTSSTRIEAESR